jgi:DNA-binding PadR family transcriptional regulator
LTREELLTKDEWLRLQIALIRYSELGSKDSPLSDPLEAALLVAIARQGKEYPYLNQNQFGVLLKKPKKGTLASAKGRLEDKGFCKELSAKDREDLKLPVNRRDKYFRITDRGLRALKEHDRVTASLPGAIMDHVRLGPDYASVINETDLLLNQYLKERFEASQLAGAGGPDRRGAVENALTPAGF